MNLSIPINQLPLVTTVASGDLFPMQQAATGLTVAVPETVLSGVIDGTGAFLPVSSGFSLTLTTRRTVLICATSISAGRIILPLNPVNTQLVTVTATQQVVILILLPNTGNSVVLAPTFMSPGWPVTFMFNSANATWYPT